MHQSLKMLDMGIRWLCTFSLGVAAICIALMAIIGTTDVIGTSLLGRPWRVRLRCLKSRWLSWFLLAFLRPR